PGVAIGQYIFDMRAAVALGYFKGLDPPPKGHGWEEIFSTSTLNRFASLGRRCHRLVRNHIQSLLNPHPPTSEDVARTLSEATLDGPLLIPQNAARMQLPFDIQDYTDFYAGR